MISNLDSGQYCATLYYVSGSARRLCKALASQQLATASEILSIVQRRISSLNKFTLSELQWDTGGLGDLIVQNAERMQL